MSTRFPILFFLASAVSAAAQTPAAAPAANGTILLDPVIVTGRLDQARSLILPDLGATSFLIDQRQIEDQPQGADAPFSQILLRAPGVAEDSAANGDLHIRGEHANLQYRINGVLLPEGISGFGLELDPRFVNSLQLITGSLPAQYGFRTAGVVDIQTKSGAFAPGGEASVSGGSFGTFRPAFEFGGSVGKLSAFADASDDHNNEGIENPTPSATPLHDETSQLRVFSYLSYLLDDSSRISAMLSVSDSKFQVPDTPGLDAGTSPDGQPWLPGRFASAALNENQREQNYYGVVAYQKSAGELNLQVSAFGRASRVHFIPDPTGDLYFNGVASDVDRKLYSGGLQADGSRGLGAAHTLRGGLSLLPESVDADSTTTVFPVDSGGDPDGPAFPIVNKERLHGVFAGSYLQDEWRIGSALTINYGARFDVFDSSFDRENQLSPRLNLIYQAAAATTLHAGYARYFTPPPVEDVPAGTVAAFDGTSNASATDRDDPVKAERSDYFDAGVSQRLAPGFQVGLDGYYKRAKNQLDDGLFGQTLILSAFNYARGEVYGAELMASYARGGFSAYANLARSTAKGEDWTSSQFLFDPADLAYVKNHWIHLDHDQKLSGSCGAAYLWKERRGSTRIYADAIYGSGLRTGATAADGSNIPNGGTVPAYEVFNAGVEQTFGTDARRSWKLRLDVVNLADKSYELRDGSGVGVNAAQYGQRRGLFASLSWLF